MLELGLKVLIGYLLGSLNGSLIVGRVRGVDLREIGSGNPGGTNALRTQGKGFAFWVMLIDVGKGFVPAQFFPGLELPAVPLDPAVSRAWLALACGAAAVVGHCYPVWFEFSGGKGAATAIGALLALAPALLLPAGVVWAVVLMLSGYVGLATMSAAIAMPAWLGIGGVAGRSDLFIFTVLLAAFIVFTHRSNIRRMRRGCEGRMERAMLLRRRSSK